MRFSQAIVRHLDLSLMGSHYKVLSTSITRYTLQLIPRSDFFIGVAQATHQPLNESISVFTEKRKTNSYTSLGLFAGKGGWRTNKTQPTGTLWDSQKQQLSLPTPCHASTSQHTTDSDSHSKPSFHSHSSRNGPITLQMIPHSIPRATAEAHTKNVSKGRQPIQCLSSVPSLTSLGDIYFTRSGSNVALLDSAIEGQRTNLILKGSVKLCLNPR